MKRIFEVLAALGIIRTRVTYLEPLQQQHELIMFYLKQEVGNIEGVHSSVFLGLNLGLRPNLADRLGDEWARAVNRERLPATSAVGDHLGPFAQHRCHQHRKDEDQLHLIVDFFSCKSNN